MFFAKNKYALRIALGAITVSLCLASAVYAQSRSEESKFITDLKNAADQGNAEAQFNLGNSYYVGIGVAKNYPEAVKWFTKSAMQGFPKAESALGYMYYSGFGIPKETSEALKWWRKAAEHHNGDAQTQLGFAYLLGDGVPKDHVKAYMWFNLAASNHDKHAIKDRDTVAKYMSAGQIAEAQRIQMEWVQTHP